MTSPQFNPEQEKAIAFGEGPLLILAGAGTGKTTVITERIRRLIVEKHLDPSRILALTFTEKAAKEMEERIDIALPYGSMGVTVVTFHAFCDRILRDEAIHIGLNPSFKLHTEADSVAFLKKHLFSLHLNYFLPLGNPNKFIAGLLQHFSRLKDEDITPLQYRAFVESDEAGSDVVDQKEEKAKLLELAAAYEIYEKLKIQEGVMDFADVIANVLTLFRTRKNILDKYQKYYQYILIDEFQDTNFAQNKLAELLCGTHQNITVVGDDDQAIYRWRGASVSNMLAFRKHFPQTTIVTLTKNYRSTQPILDGAYKVIQYNNPDRLEVKEGVDKKLVAIRKQKASAPQLFLYKQGEDEADGVVTTIRSLMKTKGYSYRDFAILVRANDHAQLFMKALERHAIPYQFLGPSSLFLKDEVKDLVCYLRLLTNVADAQSCYRVLHMPIFGFSAVSIAALVSLAKKRNSSLFESLGMTTMLPISSEEKEKMKNLRMLIEEQLSHLGKESVGRLLYRFLEKTGLLTHYAKTQDPDVLEKAQLVALFFDKIRVFESGNTDSSVFAFIEWLDVTLQMGEGPQSSAGDWQETNAVNILTIHASKGLEFANVFIVNLVTQRFPSRQRREQIPIPQQLIQETLPEGDYHLEEERRLFYVALTRAKDAVFLTASRMYSDAKRERKLSPFLEELFGTDYLDQQLRTPATQKQLSLFDLSFEHRTTHVEGPSSQLLPVTYLSYSQIQTFDVCPLHYKLRYILKVPSALSSPLSFGISMHAALKLLYQQVGQAGRESKEVVEKQLQQVWVSEGYMSKAHEQAAFVKGVRVLHEYLSKHLVIPTHERGFEVPFQFFVKNPLTNTPTKILGRIDRIDTKDDVVREIIDYKTGSIPKDEKSIHTNLQLTLYALAVSSLQDPLFHTSPENLLLSLHYVEENKILTTTRTQEQLKEAEEMLGAKIEEIMKSDFRCSHSIFCHNCEYSMLCGKSV